MLQKLDLTVIHIYKKPAQCAGFEYLAERKGFEPSIELPLYQLSRRALSTTQAPLYWKGRN